MASLNIAPLNFSDIDFTNKRQMKKLQNHLFMLTEQLRFTLNNLSLDDLNNLTNSIDNKMIKPGAISDDKLYSRYMLADTAHFTFATIEQLTADYINANQIAAKYATIEHLQAEDGYIASLRADVANIGNIMAGNIGSGSLQSLVINSVNTSIANATIKSAMIESINTGEVEIASSDGKLVVADNTIQIKDNNRVRVQLGKDELGDYNLYIWDNYGNLMFDAAGLHEDGIKDAIIRDSMVAPNANISAAKIFVENGEGGEKLSILFNEMDSDITSLQTSVELANGKFGVLMSDAEYEQNQGGATLYTKYSVLTQDVNSFKTQITEQISNAPIYTWIKYSNDSAGANMDDNPTDKLYIGIAYGNSTQTPSDDPADYMWTKIKGDQGIQGPDGEDGKTTYTWIKYADDAQGNNISDDPADKRYLGLAYNKTTSTESDNAADYSWSPLYDNVKVGAKNLLKLSGNPVANSSYPIKSYDFTESIPQGTQVTVSIKGCLGQNKTQFGLYNSGGSVNIINLNSSDLNSNGVFVKTFDWVIGTSENTHLSVYPMPSSVSEESGIQWIQLEKGNVASDWSPAPEDIERHFETVESSISQNANDITLKVSKNDLVNQINLSSEGIKIEGNRVDILGNTVFSSLIDTEGGQTVIDGAKIKTGSINARDITAGTLQSTSGNTRINLDDDTMSLGSGALSWDGIKLSALGDFTTKDPLSNRGAIMRGFNRQVAPEIHQYGAELLFFDYYGIQTARIANYEEENAYTGTWIQSGIEIDCPNGVELNGGTRGVTINGEELMTAREIYPWNETGVVSGRLYVALSTDYFSHFLVTYSIGGAALETQIVENYSAHRYIYLKTINLANGPSTSTSHAIYEARLQIYSTYFEFDYNRGVQVGNGAYSASPLEDQFIIKRIVGLRLRLS